MLAERRDFKIDRYSVASGIRTEGVTDTSTGNVCGAPPPAGLLPAVLPQPAPKTRKETRKIAAAAIRRETLTRMDFAVCEGALIRMKKTFSPECMRYVISSLRSEGHAAGFPYPLDAGASHPLLLLPIL